MKVLWITNGLLPEATAKLRGDKELKASGGWILALSTALIQKSEIKIIIAGISNLTSTLTKVEGEKITYYAIPQGKGDERYNNEYEACYREIYNKENPDVVHINGTEFPHSLAAFKACGPERTLVSIQGMASVYAPYFMAGLSTVDVWRNLTIHDLIKGGLNQAHRQMYKRGEYEVEVLKFARFITGRTTWDRDNVWAINPKAVFFPCNRILRNEFYEGQWEYGKCIPESIFLSQAGKALKGLHKVLEAMSIVVEHYPKTQLRIAGKDITKYKGKFTDCFHITTYGNIIGKMIKNYHLENNVTFTGPLNAEEMKREYLRANVFICPSSIENSPNSLGEAQILGVPSICSYVGGSMDMMKGDEDNLYRFEEVGMLAAKICQIFDKKGKIDTSFMREKAIRRHNPDQNAEVQLEIYHKIIEMCSEM